MTQCVHSQELADVHICELFRQIRSLALGRRWGRDTPHPKNQNLFVLFPFLWQVLSLRAQTVSHLILLRCNISRFIFPGIIDVVESYLETV